jgi:hypothetical protein
MTTHPVSYPEPHCIPVTWFREEAASAGVIPRPAVYFQPQDTYLNRCWRAAGVSPCPRAAHHYKSGFLNASDSGGGFWEGDCVMCQQCGLLAPYTVFNGEGWYEDVAVAMVARPYAQEWRTPGRTPKTWFLTAEDPEITLWLTGAEPEWRA